MTGWHTLALSLGEAAHRAYVEETTRFTRAGSFLRRNRRRSQFRDTKLCAKYSLAYDEYRIGICRQLRHNDIRKGGA